MTITLDQLRAANIRRQNMWPGGEKITPAFRGLELVGEVGELANLLKKLVRIELGIKGTREDKPALLGMIEEEIGDVAICLDLLGMQHAEESGRGKAPSLVDKPLDPSTYADAICKAGTNLADTAGTVADDAALGLSGHVTASLPVAWAALEDVAYCVRMDVMKCAQLKFNLTSRKLGFDVILGE